MTMGQAKQRVKAFARKNLVGKTVRNRADGTAILIPWQGIKHTLARRACRPTIAAFGKLDEVIVSALPLRSEPDREGRPNVKAVQYYEADVRVAGKPAVIRVIVREGLDSRRYYEHFDVSEQRNPAEGPGDSGSIQENGGVRPPGGDNRNIRSDAALGKGSQDADSLRDRIAQARQERSERLLQAGIRDEEITSPEGFAEEAGRRFLPPASKESLVDRMKGMIEDQRSRLLAVLPLNYLPDFARPGQKAIGDYLDVKRRMDAWRGERQNKADDMVQEWRKRAGAIAGVACRERRRAAKL
jgi:hypothetical protein